MYNGWFVPRYNDAYGLEVVDDWNKELNDIMNVFSDNGMSFCDISLCQFIEAIISGFVPDGIDPFSYQNGLTDLMNNSAAIGKAVAKLYTDKTGCDAKGQEEVDKQRESCLKKCCH